MILKGVEVVCFDTLLQVLILKEMEEGQGIGEERKGLGYTPVATGSMRNVLRMGGILALRGAYDGRSRRLREHTRGGGKKREETGTRSAEP
jgi:hypothetical protein